MVNRERKTKFFEQTSLSIDCCSLGKVLEHIQNLIKSYGKDARIEKRHYDYDGGDYFAVMVNRFETDKEMNDRICQEEKYEKIHEKHDEAEFKRLSEKFKWK